MDRYQGVVGAPELEAVPGSGVRVTHRYIQINDASGFRALNSLAGLDGTVLALDWVNGDVHRIWGSAVIVAPGIALTARHVVEHMRAEGFLQEGGGYLLALGFQQGELVIWNANYYTSIGEGDLAILTLVRANTPTVRAGDIVSVNAAIFAARRPHIGEAVSLFGFAASNTTFEDLKSNGGAALSLLGGIGPVADAWPQGRDRSMPVPCVAIAAKTVGGMSGGPAFDSKGRLIGIITSGFDDMSFVTLTWPSVFTPLVIAWPPGLVSEEATLHGLTERGLCRIEEIDALSSHVSEDGEPFVSLTS
jgi:hypothetical protein